MYYYFMGEHWQLNNREDWYPYTGPELKVSILSKKRMRGIVIWHEHRGRYHYLDRTEGQVSLFRQRVKAGIITQLEKTGWYQLKVREYGQVSLF